MDPLDFFQNNVENFSMTFFKRFKIQACLIVNESEV